MRKEFKSLLAHLKSVIDSLLSVQPILNSVTYLLSTYSLWCFSLLISGSKKTIVLLG